MDPLSITGVCLQASTIIYQNVKLYLQADANIATFDKDRAELQNTLAILRDSVKEGDGNMQSQAQWRKLKWSMDDLELAMQALAAILEDVKGDGGSGGMSRAHRAVKLQMFSQDIDSIQKRIEARFHAIQLACLFLNLYCSLKCSFSLDLVPPYVALSPTRQNSLLN